jgi:hypothetical protein
VIKNVWLTFFKISYKIQLLSQRQLSSFPSKDTITHCTARWQLFLTLQQKVHVFKLRIYRSIYLGVKCLKSSENFSFLVQNNWRNITDRHRSELVLYTVFCNKQYTTSTLKWEKTYLSFTTPSMQHKQIRKHTCITAQYVLAETCCKTQEYLKKYKKVWDDWGFISIYFKILHFNAYFGEYSIN